MCLGAIFQRNCLIHVDRYLANGDYIKQSIGTLFE